MTAKSLIAHNGQDLNPKITASSSFNLSKRQAHPPKNIFFKKNLSEKVILIQPPLKEKLALTFPFFPPRLVFHTLCFVFHKWCIAFESCMGLSFSL